MAARRHSWPSSLISTLGNILSTRDVRQTLVSLIANWDRSKRVWHRSKHQRVWTLSQSEPESKAWTLNVNARMRTEINLKEFEHFLKANLSQKRERWMWTLECELRSIQRSLNTFSKRTWSNCAPFYLSSFITEIDARSIWGRSNLVIVNDRAECKKAGENVAT